MLCPPFLHYLWFNFFHGRESQSSYLACTEETKSDIKSKKEWKRRKWRRTDMALSKEERQYRKGAFYGMTGNIKCFKVKLLIMKKRIRRRTWNCNAFETVEKTKWFEEQKWKKWFVFTEILETFLHFSLLLSHSRLLCVGSSRTCHSRKLFNKFLCFQVFSLVSSTQS